MYSHGDLIHLNYLNLNVYSGHTQHSYVLDTYIHRDHSFHLDEIGDYIFNEEYDHLNNKEKIEKAKIDYAEKLKNKINSGGRGRYTTWDDEWWQTGGTHRSSSPNQNESNTIDVQPVADTTINMETITEEQIEL